MNFEYQVQGTEAYIAAVIDADDALDTTTYGNRTYVMDRGRLTPSKIAL